MVQVQDSVGREVPAHHELLVEAFRSIQGDAREALGWIALDTKFERFVAAAISTAINRCVNKRIAHVEFSTGQTRIAGSVKQSRIDLVILEDRLPSRTNRHLDASACPIRIRYETKAGQVFDFAPAMKTKPQYLGVDLNSDLLGMAPASGAGLFFLSEIEDPTRFLKPYYVGHTTSVDAARAILEQNVRSGKLVASEIMHCGSIDQTSVKIHMFVFDPVVAVSGPAGAGGR